MSDVEGIGTGSAGGSTPPLVPEPDNGGETVSPTSAHSSAETDARTGGVAAAEGEDGAELPTAEDTAPVQDQGADDPDFVRLAPLTLDLIAERMTRLGYKFRWKEDQLDSNWEKFTLYARVAGEGMLHMWAVSGTNRDSSAHAQIAGICDGWNATQFFLKASSTVDVIDHPEEPGEKIPTCGWSLSFEAPFDAGIAPVQLSLIISGTVRNIHSFLEFAKLRNW